eukprot:5232957-Amphidinium_carterae.1
MCTQDLSTGLAKFANMLNVAVSINAKHEAQVHQVLIKAMEPVCLIDSRLTLHGNEVLRTP